MIPFVSNRVRNEESERAVAWFVNIPLANPVILFRRQKSFGVVQYKN